jgi:hypothetical protein
LSRQGKGPQGLKLSSVISVLDGDGINLKTTRLRG